VSCVVRQRLGYRPEPEIQCHLRVANVQDGWLDLSDVAKVAIPPR
jgi:hypothetical protein